MEKYLVIELHEKDAWRNWKEKVIGKKFYASGNFSQEGCMEKGYWHGALFSDAKRSPINEYYFYAVKVERVE